MNYDMTFCTGWRYRDQPRSVKEVVDSCPLRDTCERYLDYEDRPKGRPLSWFMDPPFEGETCEYHLPLSKNRSYDE